MKDNTLIRLFPIIVPNKVLFAQILVERGVYGYRGATQLNYVQPGPGKPDAPTCKWMNDHVMYLPIHSSVKDDHLEFIIKVTIEAYRDMV